MLCIDEISFCLCHPSESLEGRFSRRKRYFHLSFHFTRSYNLLRTPSIFDSWIGIVTWICITFWSCLKFVCYFEISVIFQSNGFIWWHGTVQAVTRFFSVTITVQYLFENRRKRKSQSKKIQRCWKWYQLMGKDAQAFGKSVVL